ncbi:MAG: hypothetical protein RI955_2001, partial [Bacteroidota bacterium]
EVNSGVCNYEIRQGNEFKVEVEGSYNKQDLKYEVKNNALYIENRNNNSLTVKITMPKLKGIILKGGNGESNIYDFSGEKFEIELADQNRLTVGGSVNELLVKNSDSSQLQAFDLQANNIIIEAKDNASAEVNVKNKFEATSKGSANIRYRGEPSVNRSVREGGAIEKE